MKSKKQEHQQFLNPLRLKRDKTIKNKQGWLYCSFTGDIKAHKKQHKSKKAYSRKIKHKGKYE